MAAPRATLRRFKVLSITRYCGFFVGVLFALALAAGDVDAKQCGDQSDNAKVSAADALGVLKVSVGLMNCEPCVCDTNHSGKVTAGDALLVLKFAVGQSVQLSCPGCECYQGPFPQCGGECENGKLCAQSPWDEGYCECVPACLISDTPACGGSCQGSERAEDVCTFITFSHGDVTVDRCECLPPGTKACGDASSPQCDGACAGGHECVSQSGNCECVKLPEQGPCAEADAPACGGYCGSGQICAAAGDSCACVNSTGSDPCYDVDAPMCGAPCNDGRRCAAEVISGCGCFEPCGLSSVPTCGGSCSDEQESCVVTTAKVGDSSIQFCECH